MQALIISKYCSGDKTLVILFRACNFSFYFLRTVYMVLEIPFQSMKNTVVTGTSSKRLILIQVIQGDYFVLM